VLPWSRGDKWCRGCVCNTVPPASRVRGSSQQQSRHYTTSTWRAARAWGRVDDRKQWRHEGRHDTHRVGPRQHECVGSTTQAPDDESTGVGQNSAGQRRRQRTRTLVAGGFSASTRGSAGRIKAMALIDPRTPVPLWPTATAGMAGTRRSWQAAVEATWGMVGSEKGWAEELEGEGDGLGRSDPRSDWAGGFGPQPDEADWAGLMGQFGQVYLATAQLIILLWIRQNHLKNKTNATKVFLLDNMQIIQLVNLIFNCFLSQRTII
jgi:hypothetical protein